jgi:DnaJ-class molecular chaperone
METKVRKKYPANSNHATKVHRTLRDVIDEENIICPNCRGLGTVVVCGAYPRPNEDKEMPCPVCGGEGVLN